MIDLIKNIIDNNIYFDEINYSQIKCKIIKNNKSPIVYIEHPFNNLSYRYVYYIYINSISVQVIDNINNIESAFFTIDGINYDDIDCNIKTVINEFIYDNEYFIWIIRQYLKLEKL